MRPRLLRWAFGSTWPLLALIGVLAARPELLSGCRQHASIPADSATAPAPDPRGSPAAGTLARIGFWNLRHLGHEKKDVATIAAVMDLMDVVGIAEVMTESASRELVADLEKSERGKGWAAIQSTHSVGKGERGREFYSVFYRAPARCEASSAISYPDPNDDFVREPFGVKCRVGAFDFWLVTLHVVFGKSRKGRMDEVGHLGEVMAWFRARDPHEQDVILAGDFNLPAGHRGFSALPPTMKALTDGTIPTTLGSDGHLANHYDEIFVNPRDVREATGKSTIVDLSTYVGSYKAAFDRLSDHRPVIAEFRADGPDDD